MRLIDADKLHYNRIRIFHDDGTVGGYNAVVMSAEIKDAPTVDAVPVCRCAECKHSKTDGMDDPAIYCKKWDRWEMPSDFYCKYGERKGGDE